MRHPELVARIAGRVPSGHADEVFDRQVVDTATVEPAEHVGARLRGHEVEAAYFIVGAPGAAADLRLVGGRAGDAGRKCQIGDKK
ncbi:hypothetical protein D3C72_2316390 [compost metagenome]